MDVSVSLAWRLVFAAVLVVAVFTSACARAPRRSTPTSELMRLVACALVLYGIGVVASLSHHPALAALVDGCGIATAALAAWLSRGRDQEDPPDDSRPPGDEQPPPEPEGMHPAQWARFEREFREYARRRTAARS